MKTIGQMIGQAREYTEAYANQYGIDDEVLLQAIFESHLAYLINDQIR